MIDALEEKEPPIDIIIRCKRSNVEFAKYCFTKDEADSRNTLKRFPIERPHIKFSLMMMQREKKLLFPKSRRMQMTWTACIHILWDAMFHAGKFNPVCSKKQEDAEWLLKNRIKFIYDNLDKDFPRSLLPKLSAYQNRLEFEEIGSTIQAFPQGEHQLRQFTASTIFADEIAFWDEAEGTYAAAKPTLDGGGSFIGISSPAPGFFKKMVFDEVNAGNSSDDKSFGPPKKEFPMKGIEVWKNPMNRFTVVQLHYSADPTKNSAAYKSEIKAGMPIARYNQEYELQWDSYDGMPVYPDFVKSFHGVEGDIEPQVGLPLILGFDFGLCPACVVCQLQGDVFCVLREYVEVNMGARRFAEKVAQDLRIRYPIWSNFKKDMICFVDPAGFKKAESDETTCANELAQYWDVKPGEMTLVKRLGSVEYYLTKTTKGQACFKVSISNAPVLVRGFQGGYRYPETNIGDPKPIKDFHSHIQDALQMPTSRIRLLTKQISAKIPSQQYFRQETNNGRPEKRIYGAIR